MVASILVVGAGPVGLTMAAELVRHGLNVRIIDKLAAPSPYCRAIGITSRSLEVFEDMGVARDLMDAGLWLDGVRMILPGQSPRDMRRDLSDLPYASLGVPQDQTERVLTAHLAKFGVVPERAVALVHLEPAAEGVRVEMEGPAGREVALFSYVIGCDGAHSTVRKALDIDFEGEAWPIEFMLGDVAIEWDVPRGLSVFAMHPAKDAPPDFLVAIPLPERGRYRVSAIAPERLTLHEGGTGHGIQADRPGAELADLQEVADRLLPEPAVLSDLRWSSIFRISLRLARKYRAGRVFIAGDACHIHPPTGGQGMNTGIQDAYNLAWKLALVAKGVAREDLLDSYEAERRPVAEAVIERTVQETMKLDRRDEGDRLADTQILISYRGGPLAMNSGDGLSAGDRVPDVEGLRRHGVGFPLRLFEVLKGTRFCLLVPVREAADEVGAIAARLHQRWPGLIQVVAITPAGVVLDEPPGIIWLNDASGAFASTFGTTQARLVRPDNHLGWCGPVEAVGEVEAYLAEVAGLV